MELDEWEEPPEEGNASVDQLIIGATKTTDGLPEERGEPPDVQPPVSEDEFKSESDVPFQLQ